MMKIATFLAVAALLAACVPAAAAVKIELQAEAVVTGSVVRLGDLALVDAGEAGAALRSLIICPSPSLGRTSDIAADRVRDRLSALLGAEPLEVTGTAVCRIRHASQAAPTPTSGDAAAAQATLETEIRRFVLARVSRPAREVRLEFNPRDRELLALAADHYLFKVHSSVSEFDAGAATVRADVCERASPARVVQSPHVRLGVVLVDDIVVAARDIRAGDVLAEGHLRLEQRELRDPPRGLLLRELSGAIGATARSPIAAGQIVRCEDLTKTLLVRRGDALTVHARGLGFSVKTVCRALESGEHGATVAVQGQDGSSKFYATVIGPKAVELRTRATPTQDSASPHADSPPNSSPASNRKSAPPAVRAAAIAAERSRK